MNEWNVVLLETEDSLVLMMRGSTRKVELQRNNEKYNHLTQRESKSDSEIKLVGKNIRADLKKHFPKTKFSVRMRHYTSYYISWNDE